MCKSDYSLVKLLLITILLLEAPMGFAKSQIKGIIKDAKTQKTIPGVSVSLKNTTIGTVSDFDGNYELSLSPGTYTLTASFLSYETFEKTDIIIKADEPLVLDILMAESAQSLNEVTVIGFGRINSEVSLLNSMKSSTSVISGVSSQQIAKNQDQDASEVIKRIPGISVLDDKFIVTRGLSQRYNNVWINNSATPSSESDARSFSFDIIPSSQIDNIMIVKSPQPELPADFSGGFIKVTTKGVPNENSMQLSYGGSINTETHFRDFKYNRGSSTDFLGFDNGTRQLASFVPQRVDNNDRDLVTRITQNGFNNNWVVNTKRALPNQKLGFLINRRYLMSNNRTLGVIAALNYSSSNRTFADMKNSRFGVYNSIQDKPTYIFNYTDNQFNTDIRLGGIANVVYMPNEKTKIELRNMVNQLGRNRYTERDGYQYISGLYIQRKAEYNYSSRFTYSGQLAGSHTFSEKNDLDWTAGFSYANKNQPDRRMINWEQNGFAGDLHEGQMQIDQNEITRDFLKLNEYTYSLAGNYEHKLNLNEKLNPTLKTGIYTEYRDRSFRNREFFYRWNIDNLPEDFAYRDVVSEILIPENFSADKLYIYEDTDNRNSYYGHNLLLAGYFALNIPLDKLNIYAGARIEHSKMSLESYTTIKEDYTKTKDYIYTDIFPSLNAAYNFNKDNILRFAYGQSVNRQEFRELASAVYYDFDLFSAIKGNPDLKPAYIHNFDLRYEFYPSNGEIISFAIFAKNFKNPIEWTYIDAGGSYTFTFENAKSADNYGIEIDLKKSLDFLGLKHFSLSFNGSLIKSRVNFDEENKTEHSRPMQGQSPYLINTGVFYQDEKMGFQATLLYNIIGKRIVGIGRVDTSEGSSINNDIPDMYEMPRNTIDLLVSKKWGGKFELSAGIKDILSEKMVFKQFPRFYDNDENLQQREQVIREFNPGQNISISARYIF